MTVSSDAAGLAAAVTAALADPDGSEVTRRYRRARQTDLPHCRGRQALADAGDRVAEIELHWTELVGPDRFSPCATRCRSCCTNCVLTTPHGDIIGARPGLKPPTGLPSARVLGLQPGEMNA